MNGVLSSETAQNERADITTEGQIAGQNIVMNSVQVDFENMENIYVSDDRTPFILS